MIHIGDLPFRAIPTFEAENVLKGKNGFLSLGGDKKKIANCIAEGDAEICEVAVVSEFEIEHEDDPDVPYGVILTTDRRELCVEAVMCCDSKQFFSYNEAPYNQFDACEELADNDEKRETAKCKKGYVIHYYLGKRELYKLIPPEWAADLKLLVPKLDEYGSFDCLYQLD